MSVRCHGGCTTDPMTGEVLCAVTRRWEPYCPKGDARRWDAERDDAEGEENNG